MTQEKSKRPRKAGVPAAKARPRAEDDARRRDRSVRLQYLGLGALGAAIIGGLVLWAALSTRYDGRTPGMPITAFYGTDGELLEVTNALDGARLRAAIENLYGIRVT